MTGLLAILDRARAAPSEAMVGDLPLDSRHAVRRWCSADQAFLLAEAREQHPNTQRALLHYRECVVAVDGCIQSSAVPPETAPADASELIIDGYHRWGDEVARHLDGEFAFVLWDDQRRRILCGCDVTGRRTIAFFWNGDTFFACTRAVTLLRDGRVPRGVDGVYVAQALREQWVHPPGRTAFPAIRRLRPGFSVIVESGQLQERQTDRLQLGPLRHGGRAEAYYAEFWSLLDDAARKRHPGDASSCLLLSGGLDSACVLTSLARTGKAIDAYSLVDSRASGEGARVRAALNAYPDVRWHAVAPDALGHAFSEPSPTVALTDDPVLAGVGLSASRQLLWREIAGHGFSSTIDGEGGDEVFAMAMRFGDLVSSRAWAASATYLMGLRLRAYPGLLWRSLILPNLARTTGWPGQGSGHLRCPPWLTRTFLESREAAAALANEDAWTRRWTFDQWLPSLIENAPAAGTTQANVLLQSAHGLAPTSPLFDRAIVEFASRIPARLRMDPKRSKAFLRSAAATRLPDEVSTRPKDETLHDRLLRAALASRRAAALADAAERIGLPPGWVDFSRVRAALMHVRQGHPMQTTAQEQLYALLALASWWQRVADQYGGLSWMSPS